MIYKANEDMDRVTEQIYVGNYQSAVNLPWMNPAGITHILNCTDEPHRSPVTENFVVNQLNVWDGYEIPQEKVLFAIQCIDNAIKAEGKILVHCHAGISRSTSMVIAYLMARKGMTWQQGLELVSTARPIAFPHPIVARSVKAAVGQLIDPTTTLLGGN